jgi:hypothetical protein
MLPIAVRLLFFYEGVYVPGTVTRPDVSAIELPVPDISPFVDSFDVSTPGIILVDLAHENRFEMAELSVLQARLSARGQQIEVVPSADELKAQLRYAKALVVISPGRDWVPREIEEVRRFVDRGGRLLLVTDATHFDMDFDEFGSVIFDHDTEHINGLAAQFGVTFDSDYLYNTIENAGNFRNIVLTEFGDHDLVKGLDEVVFSAARSIVSEEATLISADGETRSSNSERVEEMPVAVLAGSGDVLALGDLTFMIEPYNAISDNDRLVSNIADFLGGTQREYRLADFPFFFDQEADLVYAGDPLLDSDLLESVSAVQGLFAAKGKTLSVRDQEDRAHDTLLLGLYEQAEEVEPYLEVAGVTLSLTISTSTERIEDEDSEGDVEVTPSATSPVTITAELTSTPEAPPVGFSVTSAVTPSDEITVTEEVSPGVENHMDIASLGEVVLTGTSLLLLQADGDRQVLVVLADTETGLQNAVDRLIEGNLQDCLLQESDTPVRIDWALCPTGEVAAGNGGGGWQDQESGATTPTSIPTSPVTDTLPFTSTVEPPGPPGEPEGSIIIVALDEGEGRYDGMTSAEDYVAALGERYDVVVWSQMANGPPTFDDLLGYDLIVWTSGDFVDAFGEDASELFFLAMLEGIPFVVSGAYVGDTGIESIQRDIRVEDASHPLASGFVANDVIGFVASPSGSEYETSVIEEITEDEGMVVFTRGPSSEDTGAPSVFGLEDEFSGTRVVFIGFPLYLLPEEPKVRLIVNTISWLLSP